MANSYSDGYYQNPYGINPQGIGAVPPFEFGYDAPIQNVTVGPIIHRPPNYAGRSLGGSCVPAYKNWLYEYIYVMPSQYNLGYVLSNLSNDVEVWNAYTATSQELSVINAPPSEDTGVYLEPVVPPDYPATLPPLGSKYYNLRINFEGPPRADATFEFVFPPVSPTLRVTGYRLLIFGYIPQEPFSETYRWMTDLMASFNGEEQLVKIRTVPRREMTYNYKSSDTVQRGRLFNLITAGMGFDYGVPIWQQSRNLTAPTGTGQLDIYVDTTDSEYEVGAGCFLWQDDFAKESLEIAEVFPDHLVVIGGTTISYDTTAYCMPLAICELPQDINSNLSAVNGTDLAISFRMIESVSIPPDDLTDQYKGLDVLHDCPEIAGSTVQWTHSGNWETVDFQTGIFNNDYAVTYAKTTRAFRKTFARDYTGIWDFKQWLYKMSGRVGIFWVPSYTGKIQIVGDVTPSQVLIYIVNADLAPVYNNTGFVTDIEFEFLDGTIERRDIIAPGVVRETASEESILIGAPVDIGRTFTMADIRQISLLHRVRLASDVLKFEFDMKDQCTISFNTREVVN